MRWMIPGVLWMLACPGIGQTPDRLDAMGYTLPVGAWQQTSKPDALVFTQSLPGKGRCRIAVGRSTASLGSHAQDAAADWKGLILARFPGIPLGTTRTQAIAGSDWTFTQQTGMGKEGGVEVLLSVHTFTGHGQHMSVAFESTDPAYDPLIDQFVNSVRMQEPVSAARTSGPNPANQGLAGKPQGLVGKWRRAGSNFSHWGTHYTQSELAKSSVQGYMRWMYDLKGDGTYTFISKTWPMQGYEIFYHRENGSYRVDGSGLILSPKRSVSEVWSKNRSHLNDPESLKRSEANPLTPTHYRFDWHYFSGTKEWNLVLMADRETLRDGSFSSNTAYPNAWYYTAVGPDATVE